MLATGRNRHDRDGAGVIDAGTAPGVPGLVLDADLGSGTYGTVWRAVDLGTGEPVAVRVGRPAGGAEAVAREGALLRRLQHEHVVRLRTVVDLPRTADGDDLRALVVDLVPGGSLAGVVDRRGPLPDAEVATVAVAVARALQHLHTHGFVHGRLSARDVLFDVQGRPLVADVGLPALLAPSRPADPDLDADDDVPVYPTPADDVLGLGRLLHEALTADPDADPDGPLAALVVACLDPDPAARPTPDRIAQTARQLVTPRPVDLTAAPTPTVPTAPGWKPLPGRPPATARPVAATHLARPVSPPPPAPPTPFPVSAGSSTATARPAGPGRPSRPAPAPRRGRRRTVALVGAALSGVALLAGALVLALHTGGDPAPPSGAAPAAVATPSAAEMTAVLGRLADARAAAFMAASEAALVAVDAPGSRAHDDDVAYVQRLTKLGVRPEGLRFTVRDLRVVAATADGVTVEATVTTSAFRQVRADGTTFESLPAKTAHRVQLTLVRTGGDWRISAVV